MKLVRQWRWHLTRAWSSWITMGWATFIAFTTYEPGHKEALIALMPESWRPLAGILLAFAVFASIQGAAIIRQRED